MGKPGTHTGISRQVPKMFDQQKALSIDKLTIDVEHKSAVHQNILMKSINAIQRKQLHLSGSNHRSQNRGISPNLLTKQRVPGQYIMQTIQDHSDQYYQNSLTNNSNLKPQRLHTDIINDPSSLSPGANKSGSFFNPITMLTNLFKKSQCTN